MLNRLRAYPMVVLLLPLVAAILLFVPRPDRYASSKKAPNAMQERLYGRLAAAGLTGDELATVGALTLGYKEGLDKDLRRHFQASGAAHVLAVSGLHTGIIYGVLLWLLTLGGRVKPQYENRAGRWTVSLIILAAMWFYAWLTGMTPSVVRAVVMVSIFEIGRMVYRQAFSLNTIAGAAVLILLVKPTDLWSVSFQLSFTATAAIVLFARACEKWLHRLDWRNNVLGKAAAWIAGTIIIKINSSNTVSSSSSSGDTTSSGGKRKLTYKEKRELEQLEKDIEALEAEKKQIEEALCGGTTSVEEITKMSKRLPVLNDELDEKSMRWLELSEI